MHIKIIIFSEKEGLKNYISVFQVSTSNVTFLCIFFFLENIRDVPLQIIHMMHFNISMLIWIYNWK